MMCYLIETGMYLLHSQVYDIYKLIASMFIYIYGIHMDYFLML